MLAGLSRFCYRHRRLVVGLWLLVFVFGIAVGPSLKGESATSGRLPKLKTPPTGQLCPLRVVHSCLGIEKTTMSR